MKFNLIDKVESATAEKLVGIKQVSLAEEYLADHFPTFPVLPGVLMIEALTQAAGWVLHLRSDFACSMAVLKEARNVKYSAFAAPGSVLRLEVELTKPTPGGGVFSGTGTVVSEGSAAVQAVSARIEIAYFNLADRLDGAREMADVDRRLIEHHRARWALIAPQAQTIGV
ncbi:MAG TPA: 3-hydroxyacyl-ACP dehydratase FabZ family protein [Tepidisphaeraceae bacterium]|nr:3-hydroxyacyl-ACP dehydratase FabZ family protein [Tepidisphaeraceae bacterium]